MLAVNTNYWSESTERFVMRFVCSILWVFLLFFFFQKSFRRHMSWRKSSPQQRSVCCECTKNEVFCLIGACHSRSVTKICLFSREWFALTSAHVRVLLFFCFCLCLCLFMCVYACARVCFIVLSTTTKKFVDSWRRHGHWQCWRRRRQSVVTLRCDKCEQ